MKVIILGAGSHGLSLAYHLLKEGVDVTLVEKGEVNHGSSGRNAGRFRYHFNSKQNIEYAKEAIPYLLSICQELPLNPFCSRTGYLWILDEEEIERMKLLDSLWRSEGVGGEFIDCSQFSFLKEGKCYYAPQDGSFHHDYLSLGLYIEIAKMGGKLVRGEALSFLTSGGKVVGVKTNNGEIEGDVIAVTLGAWTGEFMSRNGISLPIKPEKREIFITEGVKFRIKPLVIGNGFYFSQTLKGELIGGADYAKEASGMDVSLIDAIDFISFIRRTVRNLDGVRLLRGWSGYYEITPDHSHIMGFDPSWPEGLFVDAGYSGHGVMFSAYSGKVMSDVILGRRNKFLDVFSPSRFQMRRLLDENMVI
ncbi:NAD(P)/FAD-dependent oxidoreductase [Sulfuracidifex metallicus]|uniref:FAD-dependent oxidoreductase n=1 Tax=Sulfuracidifex metallicus DSM 6482 = JCM 9184 TaxID=523847 RepID=A0A6A9QKI1_SULME|nr:FAD-binding oxidoreductase [Sulfuracidifex metallicus]MUN29114.1 FAD-dependent oxidoreductase [Sulfuracidifex metallicus DSM 6482 = JCM 9184]WOE50366.1 FAD-binding oxidoreductase [Sulfuracidifex metallicus DSM 6482 = JCM 9184]